MKKIINMKGELTTQQLVMLIVLIASFAVILFLIFRLNLGEVGDKEICHNSVIMKSKTSSVIEGASLNCKTNYICISGGEDCEDFNPSITMRVNPNNKDEILKAISDEMVDCWWMFGEGKIRYAEEYAGYHCAICSVIKFDRTLQFNEIYYNDLFTYLERQKKDSSSNYLWYLYGFSSLNAFKNTNQFKFFDRQRIFLDKKYSVITGMNKNFKFSDFGWNDDIIYPDFILSEKISSQTQCTIFDITKA